MNIKKGDILYCHTDGFMEFEEDGQFSTKGRTYEVVGFHHDELSIFNDDGEPHYFKREPIENGNCSWFCRGRFLLVEKNKKRTSIF